jgi:hypothetical protein
MLSFKTRPTKSKQHLETIEIQGILMNLLRKNSEDPLEVTKLAAAYMQAESQRQVLAGIGKPKSVEAKNSRGKSKKRPGEAVPLDSAPGEVS